MANSSNKVVQLGKQFTRVATLLFCNPKTIQLSPFIKDIVVTTIASAITTVSAVIVTRLLAEGLGPERFGAYSLSRRVLATAAPFTLMGMNLAITRYVAISDDNKSQNVYLLSGLLLGTIPGILLFFIGLILRNFFARLIFQDETYAPLFSVTLLLIVGYTFYIVLYAYYRGSGRINRANLWQIGVIGVGPVIVAGTLAQSGRVDIIVLFMALLFFTATLPLGYYTGNIIRNSAGITLVPPARELLEYGLPRVPAGLALAGIWAVGPFLASYVGTLKDAGYLAAGQSVLMMVEGSIVAFGLVALPKVARLAVSGNREFLRVGITDMLAFILHLGLYATLHLFLWADQIVLILLGSQYQEAIPLMQIILLAMVPYLSYVLLRSIVDAIEKKAINTTNLFLSLLVTLLTALLLVWLGLGVKGLALGTTTGFIVLGFLTIRFLWRTYRLTAYLLKWKESLLLNIGFVSITFILKQVLISSFTGIVLVGLAVCVELILISAFLAVIRKMEVHWFIELEKRVINKSSPPPHSGV